mmetsp:Transcript_31017/g.61494  ORF Transcript_31017/g.61494 Transcript_31017/m.61494 type:complete len:103 (+) Transcript_31017:206-514(+)
MVATTNEEQMKRNIEDMPTSLIQGEGLSFCDLGGERRFGAYFYAALMNCGADVAKDIGLWFERSWPTADVTDKEAEHICMFFVEISVLMKPLVKMSRIGVLR